MGIFELTTKQFSDGRITLKLTPGKTVGSMGPDHVGLCTLHPVGNTKAKYSGAAVALDAVMTDLKVNALYGDRKVYCEISERSPGDCAAFFDGVTLSWADNMPTHPYYSLIPIVVYMLMGAGGLEAEETRKAFSQLKDEFELNGRVRVSEEAMLGFCDAFYYESKTWLPTTIDMEIGQRASILPQVQQAFRTGSLDVVNWIDELEGRPSFQSVDITKAKNTRAKTFEDNGKFAKCREGEYTIGYEWTREQMDRIPELETLEDFVPNEQYYGLLDLIKFDTDRVLERLDLGINPIKAIGDNYVNVQLVGKPGTGKTTVIAALAASFGLPYRQVNLSKNTEEDVFEGLTKAGEGGFEFHETPFLDIYKNGGIIALEEYNLSDPAVVMGALGQAIEKPFILMENGYREVRRHPLCIVAATMNVGTQGSREPSEAFSSRLPNVFVLDDPDQAMMVKIFEKKGYPKKDCERVVEAYRKILARLEEDSCDDIAMSLTLRHCLTALKLMQIGKGFKDAVKLTLTGAIAIKDLALSKDINKEVVDVLRD